MNSKEKINQIMWKKNDRQLKNKLKNVAKYYDSVSGSKTAFVWPIILWKWKKKKRKY